MLQKSNKKPLVITVLQWSYLIIFSASIGLIIAMHNLPEEILNVFRVPKFLREIDPFLNFAWPSSLFVYQLTLLLFIAITFLNGVGLFFYSSRLWRLVSDFTSFLGLFVIWSVILFFIFSLSAEFFTNPENVKTAFTYLVFAFFLFILDLVTFFVDEEHLGRRFVGLRKNA